MRTVITDTDIYDAIVGMVQAAEAIGEPIGVSMSGVGILVIMPQGKRVRDMQRTIRIFLSCIGEPATLAFIADSLEEPEGDVFDAIETMLFAGEIEQLPGDGSDFLYALSTGRKPEQPAADSKVSE